MGRKPVPGSSYPRKYVNKRFRAIWIVNSADARPQLYTFENAHLGNSEYHSEEALVMGRYSEDMELVVDGT